LGDRADQGQLPGNWWRSGCLHFSSLDLEHLFALVRPVLHATGVAMPAPGTPCQHHVSSMVLTWDLAAIISLAGSAPWLQIPWGSTSKPLLHLPDWLVPSDHSNGNLSTKRAFPVLQTQNTTHTHRKETHPMTPRRSPRCDAGVDDPLQCP
jgi:hypothetical protein